MNLSLDGRYALVCGSSQGIGLAIARELAALGAQCTLLARDEARLQQAIQSLPNSQAHDYAVVDFNDHAATEPLIRGLLQQHPYHILINNSGGPAGGPITEAKPEQFLQAYHQHLLTNHLLVQLLMDGMKQEQYGRIINVISTSVKIPLKNLGVSNTTRGAVASWAKTMANELARFGITVNNVLPGATRTQRLESILDAGAQRTGRDKKVMEEEMLHEIPAARFGQPEEIAALAAFLATPAAAYINGTSIPVDGGRTGSI